MMFHQIHNDAVQKQYLEENYLIEYDDLSSNKATVYFTSNSLYYPNTKEQFIETVVKKNRFEWKRNKTDSTKKHIFVRDIFKQWYFRGINSKINSIEKLALFLSDELRGYDVTFVGSSAGGYIAVLLATMMRVDKVIVFNNQYDLEKSALLTENVHLNPLIKELSTNQKYSQYYNLNRHLDLLKCPVFYFYSIHSEIDQVQYRSIKDSDKIITFFVRSGTHGIPIDFISLKLVLNADKNDLIQIRTKKNIGDTYLYYTLMNKKDFLVSLVKKKIVELFRIKSLVKNNLCRNILKKH